LYGSSQVSLNKTFNWHAINKHPDAQWTKTTHHMITSSLKPYKNQ
jgi:hypothetical protein